MHAKFDFDLGGSPIFERGVRFDCVRREHEDDQWTRARDDCVLALQPPLERLRWQQSLLAEEVAYAAKQSQLNLDKTRLAVRPRPWPVWYLWRMMKVHYLDLYLHLYLTCTCARCVRLCAVACSGVKWWPTRDGSRWSGNCC